MAYLDAASPFMQSLVIFLREGAEAILVIAALWVALARMNAPARAGRALLLGALGGLVASIAVALLMFLLFSQLDDELLELMEGATLVLAALVLLFVSSWLLGRRESRRWRETLQQGAGAALARGGLLALPAIGFLAIFREGVETVLFSMAMLSGAGAAPALPVIAGGLLALGVLLAAFLLVRGAGLRLPLKPFFGITAWALLALAVIYAGKGVHALQEAHIISETALPGWPKLAALGIFPTVQTLLAQAAALLIGLGLNVRALRPTGGDKPAPGAAA